MIEWYGILFQLVLCWWCNHVCFVFVTRLKVVLLAWKLIVQSQSQEDIPELGKELMVDLFGSKSKDTLSSMRHSNFTKKVASAKAFVTPERLPQLPLQPHSIAYVCTIKLWCGLAWQMTWTLQIADGMVWYGMVYVDLYSAIVANVSNARMEGGKPSVDSSHDGEERCSWRTSQSYSL